MSESNWENKPCPRCKKKELECSEETRKEQNIELRKETKYGSYREAFLCGNCGFKVVVT